MNVRVFCHALRVHGNQRFSDAQVRAGVALVNEGASWPDAAARVGMSKANLYLRANALGLRRVRCREPRQGTLHLPTSPTDLAYIAAMIDGEGFVSMTKNGYYLVGIANTYKPLIDWLATFGGYVSIGTQAGRKMGGVMNGKPAPRPIYSWRVGGRRDVHALLAAVSPYMRIKKQKALDALACEEERWRTGWSGSRVRSE